MPRSRPVWAARLIVRIILNGLMWLLILAALLVAGLLASGGLREKLLEMGLGGATRFLPGTVAVSHMEWSELGHLRLVDVVWDDGQTPADTLAHVALLDLRLDVTALRARDVQVDSLQLVVSQLNGPAIAVVLQTYAAANPDTGSASAVADSTGPPAFPRPGAIPGLPSVAVSHWRVELAEAVLTADMTLSELACTGVFEARHGAPARVDVNHLELDFATTAFDTLDGLPWELSLEHLGLGISMEVEADSLAQYGLVTAVMDSLSLHFDSIGRSNIMTDGGREAWWQAAGAVHLNNTAQVTREDGVYRGIFSSDFVLPGASELASFLPEDFPKAHFGQIVGRLSLTGAFTGPGLDVTLDLDLDQTPWLDTGRLIARLDGDLDELVTTGLGAATVELDTLDFSLLGAGVRAGGSLRRGELDLVLRAAVADSQLAVMFEPEGMVDTEVALDLDARVGGTLQEPDLEVDLRGGLDTRFGRVPELSLRVKAGPAGGELALRLAGGLSVEGADLDSLTAQMKIARTEGDLLSGDFAFAAWRGADRVALGGRAWTDSLGRGSDRGVRLDSLIVVSIGQEMHLAQPATLQMGPGPWDLDLTPVVFTGEPGEFSLGGRSDDRGLDLVSRLAVLLPEELLLRIAPGDFWTDDGGKDFSLQASAALQGTRSEPTLVGQLQARLLPHRDDPNLGVDLDFALAAGDTAGIKANLAIVAADTVLLGGTIQVPGRVDAETGRWRHTAGQPARVVIPDQSLGLKILNRMLPPEVSVAGPVNMSVDVSIPLAETEADSGLVGETGAEGQIAGRLVAPKLEIELPNRSRMELGLDLQVSGALLEPMVSGQIVIESGFFRIPELPPNLHPVEAEPLLWTLAAADTLGGTPDSLRLFVPPENVGPAVEPGGLAVLPVMDLEILLPGNLRIHGYGLNIELAGDLKVGRGFDEDKRPHPKIHGEVYTVEGTLQFMNRVFTIERGVVRFTGAVPPDPDLDMKLEATVNATLVRILVTGTASDPVIELTSEPDYEQRDIMAVLLFGQPMSELDNDQRGATRDEGDPGRELRQNLAGLAMVFGTAGLQNTMSSTFGVDMVEVGSGTQGDSTLMVGKFINPKLMLKYHHSLEKSGTYFLTMEYTLSRLFKLVTTYGQGEEDSGLELKWSRRY